MGGQVVGGREAQEGGYMYQFSAIAQSCLTLCDPMDCSTPDFPAHRQILELAQSHVH